MVGGRGRDRTGDPLLAKQVLSQLSYTPTVGVALILKHFSGFQNSFLGIPVRWGEPLFNTHPVCTPTGRFAQPRFWIVSGLPPTSCHIASRFFGASRDSRAGSATWIYL